MCTRGGNLGGHLRILVAPQHTHMIVPDFILSSGGIWFFFERIYNFCPRSVLTIGIEYSFSPLYCLSSLFIDK